MKTTQKQTTKPRKFPTKKESLAIIETRRIERERTEAGGRKLSAAERDAALADFCMELQDFFQIDYGGLPPEVEAYQFQLVQKVKSIRDGVEFKSQEAP